MRGCRELRCDGSGMAMTLRARQRAFADHLRDPLGHPAPPGMDADRLAVYRELFGNNIRSLLTSNFPVISKTLGQEGWQALVQQFYAQHRSRTPLFPCIGREFIAWAQQHDIPDAPWLAELAHYEWVELDLLIDAEHDPPHDPQGDLLRGIPVLSTHARVLAYAWPVHRIGPDHQPRIAPPAPTLLLARLQEGKVRFSTLSPLLHALLEQVQHGRQSGEQILRQLAVLANTDAAVMLREGEQMLRQLHAQGVLPGVRTD